MLSLLIQYTKLHMSENVALFNFYQEIMLRSDRVQLVEHFSLTKWIVGL